MSSRAHTVPQRIGYLVPEFPAQTHIFFWREALALRDLGIELVFISTKRPDPALMSHDWCKSVAAETTYLAENSLARWTIVAAAALRAPLATRAALRSAIADRTRGAIVELASVLPSLALGLRLAQVMRDSKVAHVHVGSCGRSAEVASMAARMAGITYSLSMLGPQFSTYGARHRFKWAKASFGLFQSRQLLEEAQSVLGDCMPRLAAMAPVGVDVDRMRRDVPYPSWASGTPCKLYSCGRLNPIKGHEDVIVAVKHLRARGIDAHLRIGGEDERGGRGYRRILERHIESQGMVEFVRLLGAVSESQNFREYQDAHIYVMGSLSEAAGAVAAMEAMSLEVPVVMPGTGATPELISHGVSGLLVNARAPVELADAIEAILNDSALATRLRVAGREKVVTEYSHRRSARAIKDFLTQAGSI